MKNLLLNTLFLSLFLLPNKKCPETDSLGVRNAHAMAYDNTNKQVLLFGGADEKQVLGDLWSWDGETWTCISKEGPPPRTFPSLVSDPNKEQVILFGGNKVLFGSDEKQNQFLNDMWIWDGQKWKEVSGKMPGPRAEASIAFDSDRNRVILFGGYRITNGERVRLGDTWEWDGLQWELKSNSGPPPRNGTVMSYDPFTHRTILFWGSNEEGSTWSWDGNQWSRITTADIEGRFNPAMAFDTDRKMLIRFGGWYMGERHNGTWGFNGKTWSLITHEGPGKRNHSSMVYDENRKVIVLFGGHDGDTVFGDTWEWDGNNWFQREHTPEKARIYNGH